MNYADVISASQTAVALAIRLYAGAWGAAYVNYLLGQASFTAQLADLGQKVQNGNATPADYMEVAKAGGDILVGLGTLTGVMAPVVGYGWVAVGVGLFIYKHKDQISQAIDDLGPQPYKWKNDLPADFFDDIQRQLDELTGAWVAIPPTVNTCTRDALALDRLPPVVSCPLILDLDGGGISNSGIESGYPILFDHDGDGLRNATGWVGAGEAIVVRDLDGNGTIDSGREIFGDNTLLTRGPKAGQRAANGFEALADLDSNNDGQFNAADAAFASVKLWKDANQNGISEAGELFTFAQLGVQGIKVSGWVDGTRLTDADGELTGNRQTLASRFIWGNGGNGQAGTTGLAAN